MTFLGGTPRSVWLSIAGGVSVAYVFIHLLPELAAGQETLRHVTGQLPFADRHVYLMTLVGLILFYGLDRLAKHSQAASGERPRTGRSPGERRETSPAVFWIHIGAFGLYNVLITYLLLHRESSTTGSLTFYAVAMVLHFLVNDSGLHQDHARDYRTRGRWVLATAVLAGWTLGVLTTVSDASIVALTSVLAGGAILNVLKEEVPSERQSRFWAFALGAGGYSALLLLA